MLERIGPIVREVRESDHRSLDELAAMSGVPATLIQTLEAGQSGISTVQLAQLASALSLDYPALLNGRKLVRPAPSVFLRHAANQDFDDRDAAALDEALEQGRVLAGLRAMLGDAPSALQAGVFTQREASAAKQEASAQDGYALARDVRRWLGEPGEALGDLRAIVEDRFGIAVLVRALESSRVTAVGLRSAGAAVVVLNARDLQRSRNPLLARVYMAHELCHALFDPSPGGLHIVLDVDGDKKAHVAEQRARAFAAELLLPLEGLTQLLGPPGRLYDFTGAPEMVSRARSRFGTPHELAANHLCNLGFIDGRLRDWLVAATTKYTGAPPSTSLPAAGAPSVRVQDEVQRAHRESLVTDSEARQMLGLDALAPLPWDEPEL